jgi:hypothetical protein
MKLLPVLCLALLFASCAHLDVGKGHRMPINEVAASKATHTFPQPNGEILVAGPPVSAAFGTHPLLIGFQALVTKKGTRYWLRVDGLSKDRSTVRVKREFFTYHEREKYTFVFRNLTIDFPPYYFDAFLKAVDAVPRPK